MSPSSIDIRTDGGLLVVSPVGDVDLSNAEDLRAAILAAFSNEGAAVIVDLSRTHYLDSAGIRVLFFVGRRLEERRRRLVLVVPANAPTRRILSIVDMEGKASVYERLEDAREDLRKR